MDFVFIFGVIAVIAGFIAWAWVKGIDDMIDNHPDYKGEDLFDEVPKKKDEWDDNKQHTKQNI